MLLGVNLFCSLSGKKEDLPNGNFVSFGVEYNKVSEEAARF